LAARPAAGLRFGKKFSVKAVQVIKETSTVIAPAIVCEPRLG
jgi:hypothetical protein